MPIQNSTSKSCTNSTWVQLGTGNYPSVPGTLVISGGAAVFVGPTNADASAWAYWPASALPGSIYVPDIASVWIKTDATTNMYISYYPATETPVAPR
jgi:hypothetical protein